MICIFANWNWDYDFLELKHHSKFLVNLQNSKKYWVLQP